MQWDPCKVLLKKRPTLGSRNTDGEDNRMQGGKDAAAPPERPSGLIEDSLRVAQWKWVLR